MNNSTHLSEGIRLLFITSTHPSWGKAHRQRVFAWVKEFSPGSDCEVLDLVLEKQYEPLPGMLSFTQDASDHHATDIDLDITITPIRRWKEFLDWKGDRRFDLVIIDRREPPPILIESLSPMPIIVFDIRSDLPESHLRRHYQTSLKKITYVVNPIPSLEEDWANLNGLGYLILPDSKEPVITRSGKSNIKPTPDQKNTVVYLGEFDDPDYLNQVFRDINKMVTMPNFYRRFPRPLPVKIIASPRIINSVKALLQKEGLNPTESFCQYSFQPFDYRGMTWNGVEVVFTHFGLMGLEAIKRGIEVYFLEPTDYHRELVVKHFPELLLSKVSDNPSLKTISPLKKRLENLRKIGEEKKRLWDIFRELAKSGKNTLSNPHHSQKSFLSLCDLCGETLSIEHRRSWMNLCLCSGCGSYQLTTMYADASSSREKQIWGLPEEDYDSEYFISEYERSYGKSYQEDEPEIKKLARARMKVVKRLCQDQYPRLLDIGCAYGFFLDVAAEFGCDTFGVDISSHAGKQIRGHRFIRGDFREESIMASLKTSMRKTPGSSENPGFDIITLWYVIEHFPEIDPVIEKIFALHNPGGILGLSTPNAAGLSARFRNREFLASSPSDHFYIFSLAGLKKIMSKHGYDFIDYRATGIHYSRFKEARPRLAPCVPQALYERWAAFTNFGDTMEVYFQKRLNRAKQNLAVAETKLKGKSL